MSETTLDPDRCARAATALNEGLATIRAGPEPGTFEVVSFTADATYRVNLQDRSCTCPDAAYRGQICKHLLAVLLSGGGTA